MTDSYARVGVNIAEGNRAVELMKAAVKSTHDARVLAGIGAFGGMFDASALKSCKAPVLVASTDGVGTKTKIAAAMNRWDTIGQDLVNHCVNDILVQGATPLFFMDYLAASKLDASKAATIVMGMALACREHNMALLGGETAEMPGIYCEGEVDVAGTIVGVVDRSQVIDGTRIENGDVILGLTSSGLHTNGYSLARRALASLDWKARCDDLNDSIGNSLLKIHRCYLPHFQKLNRAGIDIHGMAHITGGGLIENVPRVLPARLAAAFDLGAWQAPPIFELIQREGGIDEGEMFRVFNMGVGFCLMMSRADARRAIETLSEGIVVGNIVERIHDAVLLSR
jgi:phosphoribosylformylglycinamidine cyclo-ligase